MAFTDLEIFEEFATATSGVIERFVDFDDAFRGGYTVFTRVTRSEEEIAAARVRSAARHIATRKRSNDRWYARLKANPVRWAAFRAKQLVNERKRLAKQKADPELLAKARERSRTWARKKRDPERRREVNRRAYAKMKTDPVRLAARREKQRIVAKEAKCLKPEIE